MKLISRIYTTEALLCAGVPSLLAPLMLAAPVALPMELAAASFVLLTAVASVTAMFAYWQLALDTIAHKQFKFGKLFWLGLAGGASVITVLLFAANGGIAEVSPTAGQFWLLVSTPTALSAGHFTYLQLYRRQEGETLQMVDGQSEMP